MLGPFPPALTWVVALVAAALTGLVVRRHWWLTRVSSWSMYPTLRPGAVIGTRRLSPMAPIHRGDIVVFELPEPAGRPSRSESPTPGRPSRSESPTPGRRMVKRVIGLPGETVQVTLDRVLIDASPLAEPYVTHRGGPTGTYKVPANSYFVLGDNRALSTDSRSWRRSIPRSAMTGTLRSTSSPPDSIGARRPAQQSQHRQTRRSGRAALGEGLEGPESMRQIVARGLAKTALYRP